MVAPAPGRLSMMTCWPSVVDRCCATSRPMTSTGPPAGNGTSSLIGRDGYRSCARSWACAGRPAKRHAAMAASATARRMGVNSPRLGLTAGGRLQNGDHVLVAARAGVAERGGALAVLDLGVGTGLDQEIDAFDVALAVVAEHHGDDQRSPAHAVD